MVTVKPGDMSLKTPDVLILRRKDAPYRLTFTMEGYEPYAVTIVSDTNGWIYANVILGGIIGMIIDGSTGAANVLAATLIGIPFLPFALWQGELDDRIYVSLPRKSE